MSEQLAKIKSAIDSNPHLHSARINRDYLTIGIEIVPQFPELAQKVEMTDLYKRKFHAIMVPFETVIEAMEYVAPAPKQE